MDLEIWLSRQSNEIQNKFWNKLAIFLSDRELRNVMRGINSGKTIFLAHKDSNLFDKYSVDIERIKSSFE